MTPLTRFWREEYGVDQPLEADSWARRLLNRYLVAALMNTFPGTATRVFSRSRGDLARLLFAEREGGSFRVLRAMYEYEDRRRRGDVINRLLMQSPAVKAARNRRRIAQRMLELCLEAQTPDRPVLVLAIGGGDGSLEAQVIARLGRPDVYYCGVDKDERAVAENREVLRRHGLEARGVTLPGTIAGPDDLEAALRSAARQIGARFDGVGVCVCQGIAEYLDIGSPGNDALAALLGALYDGTRPEGALIISQTGRHDRVKYLERALSWHMRLRGGGELAAEVERAGWLICGCEQEPMKLITMCLAVKSDAARLRVDPGSPLRRPRARSLVASSAARRTAG